MLKRGGYILKGGVTGKGTKTLAILKGGGGDLQKGQWVLKGNYGKRVLQTYIKALQKMYFVGKLTKTDEN